MTDHEAYRGASLSFGGRIVDLLSRMENSQGALLVLCDDDLFVPVAAKQT